MRIRHSISIMTCAVIGAGCAPLEQAPLVYASKVAVGIDLSGTVSEQPGLSATVGYKQVDAAYVPVAVARKCDGETVNGSDTARSEGAALSRCSGDIYRIVEIKGGVVDRNGSSAQSQESKEKLERAQEILKRLTLAKGIRDKADSLKAEAERELAGLRIARDKAVSAFDDAKKEFDRTRSAASGAEDVFKDTDANSEQARRSLDVSPGAQKAEAKKALEAADAAARSAKETLEKARAAKLAGEKKALEAETKLKEIDSQILVAQNSLAKRTQEAAEAENKVKEFDLSKIADSLQIVGTGSDNTKSDAYSVFGSFDTGTKVGVGAETGGTGKADSGITIGKIFSTGTASQNITEGISRYYRSLALARIMDSYKDCIGAIEKRLVAIGLPADRTKASDPEKELARNAYADCTRIMDSTVKDLAAGGK